MNEKNNKSNNSLINLLTPIYHKRDSGSNISVLMAQLKHVNHTYKSKNNYIVDYFTVIAPAIRS